MSTQNATLDDYTDDLPKNPVECGGCGDTIARERWPHHAAGCDGVDIEVDL